MDLKDQLKLIASEIIHKQNYVSRNDTEVNYQIQKDIKTDGCSFSNRQSESSDSPVHNR